MAYYHSQDDHQSKGYDQGACRSRRYILGQTGAVVVEQDHRNADPGRKALVICQG